TTHHLVIEKIDRLRYENIESKNFVLINKRWYILIQLDKSIGSINFDTFKIHLICESSDEDTFNINVKVSILPYNPLYQPKTEFVQYTILSPCDPLFPPIKYKLTSLLTKNYAMNNTLQMEISIERDTPLIEIIQNPDFIVKYLQDTNKVSNFSISLNAGRLLEAPLESSIFKCYLGEWYAIVKFEQKKESDDELLFFFIFKKINLEYKNIKITIKMSPVIDYDLPIVKECDYKSVTPKDVLKPITFYLHENELQKYISEDLLKFVVKFEPHDNIEINIVTLIRSDEDSKTDFITETINLSESLDLDHAMDSEGRLRFVVNNFINKTDNNVQTRLHSDSIRVRNMNWRILLMRPSYANENRLSFFLKVDSPDDNVSWNVNASAKLKLCSLNGQDDIEKSIRHVFNHRENDWGYKSFVAWEILTNDKGVYVTPDGSFTVEAHIQADAPHGLSWDSKVQTGYVGIRNQGATCYMNSVLQTFFFTNKLRKSIYEIPTDDSKSSNNVAFSMQRLFYELQTSKKEILTKQLTKSFGWESVDSLMQQDVQEFLRVLLDNLETKMKGTVVENVVPELFKGDYTSYISCIDVDYSSEVHESFYDIQLNIKNIKGVEESFEDYVKCEILDGDNKYKAGDHGLQKAEKGVIFTKFPPVLHLLLKRFQYDMYSDSNEKIYDRFEFPERLDLTRFLREPRKNDDLAIYRLQAVLVHAGDNSGGHYVAYIDPMCNGKWFKFDDEIVCQCSKEQAIENNFGGDYHDGDHYFKNATSAYMLVYINESEIEQLLLDILLTDIPGNVVARLKDEIECENVKNRCSSSVNIELYHSNDMKNCTGIDFTDLECEKKCYVLPKYSTFQTVKNAVASLEEREFRLYLCQQNGRTWKMIYIGDEDLPHGTLESLVCSTIKFYIEILEDSKFDYIEQCFNPTTDYIMFVKFFEPLNDKVYHLGTLIISCSDTLLSIITRATQKFSNLINTEILNNVTESNMEELDLNMYYIHRDNFTKIDDSLFEISFHSKSDLKHHDGDILIFERNVENEPVTTIEQFIAYKWYSVDILVYNDNDLEQKRFVLELNMRDNYENLIQEVATKLNITPDCIILYRCIIYDNKLRVSNIIEHNSDEISDILMINERQCISERPVRMIMYKILNKVRHNTEKSIKIGVIFSEDKLHRDVIVNTTQKDNIGHLIAYVLETLGIEKPVTEFRCMAIKDHAIINVLPFDKLIHPLKHMLNIDTINKNNSSVENQHEHERLITCTHFVGEPNYAFGNPFILKIVKSESFEKLTSRIREMTSLPSYDKFRIVLVNGSKCKYIDEKNPTVSLIFELINPKESINKTIEDSIWIGIDHPNRTNKRNRVANERSIRINN
ncbi:hypothetical protein A3Q56_06062, partial [Intoshia linei]